MTANTVSIVGISYFPPGRWHISLTHVTDLLWAFNSQPANNSTTNIDTFLLFSFLKILQVSFYVSTSFYVFLPNK